MVGRYTVIRPFKQEIQRHKNVETLGNFIGPEDKERIAYGYHDRERTIEEIGSYSWAVPDVPSPFVGHGPKPGTHDNSNINSLQFRADIELADPKPPHVYRIFLTGGSTAYGTGAPDLQTTIAGYLSNLLNTKLSESTNFKYEVLTMANSAWASTQERIMIENRLSELDPDMVISFSGNNDIHWGIGKRNVLWFRSYYDELFWKIINTAYEISGYEGITDVTKIEPAPVPCSIVAERLIKNVRLSSHVLSFDDIPYVFFLQPNLDMTKKALTERESRYQAQRSTPGMSNEERKDYFIECFSQLKFELDKLKIDNFHYFNLTYVFDNKGEEEDYFIDSYHFGDKGNEVIAVNMYEQIREIIEQ